MKASHLKHLATGIALMLAGSVFADVKISNLDDFDFDYTAASAGSVQMTEFV